ncbi:MAG: single-stranded-DNA-specific exonuclease RecJ [Ruminococcus sp.]|nr:single-stranded-DNA-specific exonuclease RecJ [Ruminococcus sp.]
MKKWTVGTPDRSVVNKLMINCGTTSLTASVLASKGYTSSDEVVEKLSVQEFSDPFLIRDMQLAADAINEAIENESRICVYGDYDCDGIMAAVMLYSYLLEAGADVEYYIPERSVGYGLNKEAVRRIADNGIDLIITVDNGISAIEEADYIYELGMKLVVTDHHQQGEELPRAEAVVDPHRHDDTSPFKLMCGAGIVLKLIAALDGGDYTMAVEQFADLAAIATVADVVPLVGENRLLVSCGMQLIDHTDRPALIALKEVSMLADKAIDTRSIGFGLAPRINASGRFGSPASAAELLLCEDYDEAIVTAQELDTLNNLRKSEENSILAEIYGMIAEDPQLVRGRVIFLCGEGWHHGVIGIVAARIMEQFGKPTFIASEENGEIRGSARSFGDFSIFAALTAASEVLEKFGGHPGAGGFTIKNGLAGEFRELLEAYAMKEHRVMPVASLSAECRVTPMELTPNMIDSLSVLEPYGTGNEKPLFYLEEAKILSIMPVSGNKHTKIRFHLVSSDYEGMLFWTPTTALCFKVGDVCDIMANLSVNRFRNAVNSEVIIADIRPHGFQQSRYFAAKAAFEAFMRGEELPENYYPSMYPEREDVVSIYKTIPEGGVPADTLYIRLMMSGINYCKFCVSVEALRQLGLVRVDPANSKIERVKVSQKADLSSAPVLVSLRAKLGKE